VTDGSGTPGTDGRGIGTLGAPGFGFGAGLGDADGFGDAEGFEVLDGAGDGFAEELGVGRALGEAVERGAGEPAYAKPEPSGVAEPLPAAGRAAGIALIGTTATPRRYASAMDSTVRT